ncbi:MAG: hypothetical protein WC354_08010, partial [Candidatus Omnitrophota bacterium]
TLSVIPGVKTANVEQTDGGRFVRSTGRWYRLTKADPCLHPQIIAAGERTFSVSKDVMFQRGQMYVFTDTHPGILAIARWYQGRRAVLISNYSDQQVGTVIPLGAATSELRLWDSENSDYYVLIDWLSGEVFLRMGSDLRAQGVFVDLPGHQSHLFMIKPVADRRKEPQLFEIWRKAEGRSLPLEDVYFLVDECGIGLDFPCYGTILKAELLRLLMRNRSLAEIAVLLEPSSELPSGVIRFQEEGPSAAEQAQVICAQYPQEQNAEYFCQVVAAADNYFGRAFNGQSIHFTLVPNDPTAVISEPERVCIQVGRPPVKSQFWGFSDSDEEGTMVYRQAEVLDRNYLATRRDFFGPLSGRAKPDLAETMRALLALCDPDVFKTAWKIRDWSWNVPAELVTYFCIYGKRQELISTMPRTLTSENRYWQAEAALARVLSFTDPDMEEELFKIAMGCFIAGEKSGCQRIVFGGLAADGSPAMKSRVRSLVIEQLSARRQGHRAALLSEELPVASTEADESRHKVLMREVAPWFHDRETVDLLLGISQDLLESDEIRTQAVPEALKAMMLRDRSDEQPVFAGFLALLDDTQEFLSHLAVLKGLTLAAKDGYRDTRRLAWPGNLAVALAGCCEQRQSYLSLFFVWQALKELERYDATIREGRFAEKVACRIIAEGQTLPWISSEYLPAGAQQPITALEAPYRAVVESVVTSAAGILSDLWKSYNGREIVLARAAGQQFDSFLGVLREFGRGSGYLPLEQTTAEAVRRSRLGLYSALSAACVADHSGDEELRERTRQAESKVLALLGDGNECVYHRVFTLDLLGVFMRDWEQAGAGMTESKARRANTALDFIPVEGQTLSSQGIVFALRALRTMFSLQALDKINPAGMLERLLDLVSRQPNIRVEFFDSRPDISLAQFAFDEVEELVK